MGRTLAIELIRWLTEQGKREEARKISENTAETISREFKDVYQPDTPGMLGGKIDDYHPDLSLVPLAEAAAKYIGIKAAEQVASVHRDESVAVEVLVRAAVARSHLKDSQGCETLMNRARACAAQCKRYKDEADARCYVARGLVLLGDESAAKDYVRSCKEKSDVIGKKVAEFLESSGQPSDQPQSNDFDLLAFVEQLRSGDDPTEAFQKAALISDSQSLGAGVDAYLHLMKVAPHAPQWTEVRRQWKARASSAAAKPDALLRSTALSSVAGLQAAVFGISDPDVGVTLEALTRTKWPKAVVEDEIETKISPEFAETVQGSSAAEVVIQAARGEIYRGNLDIAEELLAQRYSNRITNLRAQIIAAYIERGELENAEQMVKEYGLPSDPIFNDIAKAWRLCGDMGEAFRVACLGSAPDCNDILGEIVAYQAATNDLEAVVSLVKGRIEDPRQRIAILTKAATVLASWCDK